MTKSNSTQEQALKAKATLRAALARPVWLQGVGIGLLKPGQYVVKVNVDVLTEQVRAQIPEQVEGVLVVVEAIGTVHPQPEIES